MTDRKELVLDSLETKPYGKKSDKLCNTTEVTITLTVAELGLIAHVLSVKEQTEEFNEASEKTSKELNAPFVPLTIENVLEISADKRKALGEKLDPTHDTALEAIWDRMWYWLMGRRFHYSHDPRKKSNPFFTEYLGWFWKDPRNRGWKKEIG